MSFLCTMKDKIPPINHENVLHSFDEGQIPPINHENVLHSFDEGQNSSTQP
ncbi:hypothetical protein J2Y67_000276 [Neobacillus niacini]|nr:hypothetical protein [Neobacillus niacini]